MRILFAISVCSFLALIWAMWSITRHIRTRHSQTRKAVMPSTAPGTAGERFRAINQSSPSLPATRSGAYPSNF